MKTIIRPAILIVAIVMYSFGYAQLPKLNSLPTATATMYLDFDGHTVAGTYWNWNGPIFTGSAGLTNDQITEIFNRVAEDYRPFNLNITTDSMKFLAAPLSQRMRVILTMTSDWYGQVGGVAAVGSFTWGDDTPAFVFTQLLNFNTRYIAEAVSHEAGHTLNLYHQSRYDSSCAWVSEYNYGAGAGEIGWAPIMGNAYYQNLTQWNYGPNIFGCQSMQDELSVITTANGFGYRTDDHDAAFNRATTISVSGNAFQANGIIEKHNDMDLFKLQVKKDGMVHVAVNPFSAGSGNSGSNLDVKLSLYNRRSQLIGQYNPSSSLGVVIDTVLESGAYYLAVEGKGNEFAPDYASLGSYQITGDMQMGVTAARNAVFEDKFAKPAIPVTEHPYLVNKTVKNSLSIQSPGSYEYTILNMNGGMISKGKTSPGLNTVTLPWLSQGMYFVSFSKADKKATEKFFVSAAL